MMANGHPRLLRPIYRLVLRPPVLGRDVVGEVLAVGDGVAGIAPGDAVLGEAGGAWAERVVVSADALAVVPAHLDASLLAALPVAGVTALQGLRRGGVTSGSRVLVVGASGGVGHLAVQIARRLGATVDGVCSGPNASFVQSNGAETVLDYARERFTDHAGAWDCVFDLAGREPLTACLRALRPGGRYVGSAGELGADAADGTVGAWLGPLPRILATAARGLVDARVHALTTRPDPDDLRTLAGFVADGSLKPCVEVQPLEAAPGEVFPLARPGRRPGRVVLEV